MVETEAPVVTEEAAPALDVTKLKVAYVGISTVSPYQKTNQAGIAAKAEELGITDVKYVNPPNDNDLETQLQLMDAAILEKPDIILLVPVDSAAIGEAVQAAQDAGIVVITIGIESVAVPQCPRRHRQRQHLVRSR